MRCIAMTFLTVMITGLFAAAGCRGDDDNPSNNNNNDNSVTDDHTIYQVQDESHPSHLQDGDPVQIERVVVTAVDKDDSDGYTGNVWVQEPDGGAYSGIKVFAPAILPGGSLDGINVGDLVDVSGTVDEYHYDPTDDTVTEIIDGSVNVLGQADPLTPEVLGAQTVMDPASAEPWEGVLVRVESVRVTDRNEGWGQATFTGGLVAKDALWDVYANTVLDTCYLSVTGVVDYFYDFFVLPRGQSDLIEGQPTDCATTSAEICDDGLDNDGDTYFDCDDFECYDDPACKEFECGDGLDNDGDGDTDCDDSDCLGTVECPAPTENNDTDCADGMDNDGDNMVDCEDPSCHGHPNVTVCTETDCANGTDDDQDGHTDCDDFDCLAAGACDSNPTVEAGAVECADGVDNDSDGYTDCEDNSCQNSVVACQEDTLAACTDNDDNDEDGYADCLDFSCQYAGHCGEETSDASCSDGLDNDNDNHTDCDDFSCMRGVNNTVCEGNAVTCSDGLDNDGEGHTDCADFNCRCCPDEGLCTSSEYVVSTCPPCQ